MKSSSNPRFPGVVVSILSATDGYDYVLTLVITDHQDWPSLTDFMWNSGIEIASVKNHIAVLIQYRIPFWIYRLFVITKIAFEDVPSFDVTYDEAHCASSACVMV